ncbi:RNA 2',3'-cyclic phosphodiesterase [Candidatus Peregrinibacteria bacterium]|nr:RNA 2',3'-cyclic phosphodiesterase [Candidatus Peregrinibacteria bacterium]
MRLFISLNIPQELHDYCDKLQRTFPGIKKTEEYHLTLQFLGDEIGDSLVPRIIEALQSVAFQPFEITLGNARRFPNESRPHGVWVDCDGGDALQKLADRIRTTMSEIGLKPDKPFSAHITLGRYQNTPPPTFKPRGGRSASKTETKTFTMDRFFLMESHLKPTGAEHHIIETFKSTP